MKQPRRPPQIPSADTNDGQTEARPFTTAGAAVVLTIDPGSSLALSSRVGAGATLAHDTFEFTPNVPFHRVPPVAVSASVGVGVRSP